ncbi:MAG TPA: hypothetical protein DIT64_19655 [Verrucomicrobiales bacterium]|nr:hypothetical protein [Verrucomicrobiales bacterium]
MKFDDLDREMRRFETERDWQVPEGVFIIARMDGRGFTRLTKEVMRFEAPYDERFRDAIAATARHLMNCGFRALHAFCQSDEISLLLHPRDGTFQRKERKLLSVLAGEASAAITHALGRPACMDSRLCLLPDSARVADYFRWRMEDARRNCLNSHACWLLRRLGRDATAAHNEIEGLGVEEKTTLLAGHGIVFNELPAWQRRGFAVEWREEEKAGMDPRTGTATVTTRRRLQTILDLPDGAEYGQLILTLLRSVPDDESRMHHLAGTLTHFQVPAPIEDFYDDGMLRVHIERKPGTRLAHGFCFLQHPSGRRSWQGWFKEGVRSGQWVYWKDTDKAHVGEVTEFGDAEYTPMHSRPLDGAALSPERVILISEEYGYRSWWWWPDRPMAEIICWWKDLPTVEQWSLSGPVLPGSTIEVAEDESAAFHQKWMDHLHIRLHLHEDDDSVLHLPGGETVLHQGHPEAALQL